MADRPAVTSQPITRDKLATFLKSHELIKAFENMLKDIRQVLPDSIEQNSGTIDDLAIAADAAGTTANMALSIAEFVAQAVQQLLEGPPRAEPADDLDSRIAAILPPFPTRSDLGLGSVEDISLSTWPGSANITTLGTITTGVWNGSTIGAAWGGTGLSSYAVGDMLYANGAASLARLASAASGNVLRAAGVGSAPAWGPVALTTDVSGVLPVANGGTGVTALSSLTANPSGTIGLSAVNGSASSFMRSDAAPALSQAISPTWTGNHTFAPASGNTVFSAGSVGIRMTPVATLSVNGGTTIASLTDWNSKANTVFQLANPAVRFGVGYTAADIVELQGFDTTNAAKNIAMQRYGGSIGIGLTPSGTYLLEVNGALSISSTTLIRTATALTNGAGAAGGTLTNAPAAGNPTKWVPINDAGITRYLPAW